MKRMIPKALMGIELAPAIGGALSAGAMFGPVGIGGALAALGLGGLTAGAAYATAHPQETFNAAASSGYMYSPSTGMAIHLPASKPKQSSKPITPSLQAYVDAVNDYIFNSPMISVGGYALPDIPSYYYTSPYVNRQTVPFAATETNTDDSQGSGNNPAADPAASLTDTGVVANPDPNEETPEQKKEREERERAEQKRRELEEKAKRLDKWKLRLDWLFNPAKGVRDLKQVWTSDANPYVKGLKTIRDIYQIGHSIANGFTAAGLLLGGIGTSTKPLVLAYPSAYAADYTPGINLIPKLWGSSYVQTLSNIIGNDETTQQATETPPAATVTEPVDSTVVLDPSTGRLVNIPANDLNGSYQQLTQEQLDSITAMLNNSIRPDLFWVHKAYLNTPNRNGLPRYEFGMSYYPYPEVDSTFKLILNGEPFGRGYFKNGKLYLVPFQQ